MLIEELKNGSSEILRALIDRHSKAVIRTCYSFVQNKDDAEDIAQEVFIEVIRSINQFRSESDLGTWLYRICVNKSLDHLRKQKRNKRIADLKAFFLSRGESAKSPHNQLEEQERKELLRRQIALLPENQRIALILSQYNRLTNKKIAEVMETTESGVESLVTRARANLRKNLEKYFEKNL
jgi:RNA polymerase sigma-70 factor, ECF subfamily